MTLKPWVAVFRVLAIALLTLVMLGAGLAGLCGGFFTFASLAGPSWGEAGQGWNDGFLSIAVPSLVFGGGLAAGCGWLLVRLLREDA